MSIRALTIKPVGHYECGRSQNVIWLRQIFTLRRNILLVAAAVTAHVLATSELGRASVESVIYMIQNI